MHAHPKEREERAQRVRVTQVDMKQGRTPARREFVSKQSLLEALSETASASDVRIYVVEDLSRDVIEALGSQLRVDPHFFRYHVSDYMWNSLAGDAIERKYLDFVSRKSPYYTFQYLRPRYYRDTASFERATREAAYFNVLRELDSDRSRESMKDTRNGAVASLMRAKTSLWVSPDTAMNQGVVGKDIK